MDWCFAAHSENMRNRVEFLMEAVLMADFDHRNVMWLIAIVIDPEMKPHVILPLMEHGDLRSYIAKPTNVSLLLLCIGCQLRRSVNNSNRRHVGGILVAAV